MRILVVEDERRIAHAIKKGLEQERFAVDVAYTGIDGFDLAATEEYDALILDLMLPGMDGLEICKKLRTAKNHVQILILTAKGQIQEKIEGLDAGADDYLTKPFSFEELLARIRALLRRPKTSLPAQLVVSDLTMDTQSFEVTRSGKKIRLSKKEFSLLEYFMRHPNQILSKEKIIAHLWDYETDILPNTVEAHIRSLRKKIDAPSSGKGALIRTMRGFGYKLEG